MRPIRVTLSAAGNSQWIPIDYVEAPFAVGLAVIPWSTATGLTYTVQHTFDSGNPPSNQGISISRVAALATVFDPGPNGLGHGMTTGDNIVVEGAGPPFDTTKALIGIGDLGADITVVDNLHYTYTVLNSGPLSDSGDAKISRLRVFPHATLNTTTGNPGATGLRGDGNYAFPVRACRIKANTLTGGSIDFILLQGNAG
jgi:hypothetical protein